MWRRTLSHIKLLHALYRIVVMFYKRKLYGLNHVHKTFYMRGKSHVSHDLIAHEHTTIGNDCWIGPRVELGPYVMIAPRVAIVGKEHVYTIPGTPIVFSGEPEVEKTVIEADVWIGYGAILMAGIRVGRGAIIGAGSVVTKKYIAPYEVCWGVPARKVFERFPNPSDRELHDKMLMEKRDKQE